ncbi:MAG: DUF192 domain-containing protein [Thiotrichales bacterium]|nr:DUF192 domain-containing protein [Thiotrichales bacterium]
MKHGRVYRENDHTLILENVMLTTNPWERMRGLLARPPLTDTQGLLIRPCSSIHTIGMSFPIDVIFMDRSWRVVKTVSRIGAFRMSWCHGAEMVLETMAHSVARWGLKPDDVLRWEEN